MSNDDTYRQEALQLVSLSQVTTIAGILARSDGMAERIAELERELSTQRAERDRVVEMYQQECQEHVEAANQRLWDVQAEREAAREEARRYRTGTVRIRRLMRDGLRHLVEIGYSHADAPVDWLDYKLGPKDKSGQAFVAAADGTWMWLNCWQTKVFEAALELRAKMAAVQQPAAEEVQA